MLNAAQKGTERFNKLLGSMKGQRVQTLFGQGVLIQWHKDNDTFLIRLKHGSVYKIRFRNLTMEFVADGNEKIVLESAQVRPFN